MRKRILVSLIFFLAMVSTASGQTPNPHYTFDDTTCPVPDASGNNNDGTCFGSLPTLTNGVFDDAFSLDGSSDYVTASANNVHNTNLTVLTFVNYSEPNGNTRIINTQDGNGEGFFLGVDDGAFFSQSVVRGQIRGSTGNAQVGTPTRLDDGQPHYVGIRWFEHNNTLQLYQDNGFVDSDVTDPGDWTGSTEIGIAAQPSGGNHFNGMVDESRVYNEILTLEQIKSLNSSNSLSSSTPSSISITSPSFSQPFQRNSTNQSDIIIEGSYSNGQPDNVEARFDNNAWQVIDSNPSSGSFSGSLTGSVGQGSLDVRYSNDTSVNDSVSRITVGDIFVIAGQSNAEMRGQNLSDYNSPANGLVGLKWNSSSNKWQKADDPFHSWNQYGSSYPELMENYTAENGVPMAAVPVAQGGTTVIEWQPSSGSTSSCSSSSSCDLYDTATSIINSATNGRNDFEYLYWFQGEQDAQGDSSLGSGETFYNNFKTNTTNVFNSFEADTNASNLKVVQSQIGQDLSSTDSPHENQVRRAQRDLWNSYSWIYPGAVTYNITHEKAGDPYHFTTDEEIAQITKQLELAFDAANDGQSISHPNVSEIVKQDSTTVDVVFDRSLKQGVSLGSSPWYVVDTGDGSSVSVSSVSMNDSDSVRLGLGSSLSGEAKVSLGRWNSAVGDIVPMGTNDLRANVFYNETSATDDTTPPTSSDNWTASGFVDKTGASDTTLGITASDSGTGVANISYKVENSCGGTNGYQTVSSSSVGINISCSANSTVMYYATDSNGNIEATQTEYVAIYEKNTSVSTQRQDNSTSSNLNTQYVYKQIQADILGTAKPGNVTIQPPTGLNGSCSNCDTRYLDYSAWVEDFESYSTGSFTNLSKWKADPTYANASTSIIQGQFLEVSGGGGTNDPHFLYHRLENADVVSERTFSFNLSTNDTLYDKMLILSNSRNRFSPDQGVRIGLDSAGEFQVYTGAEGEITKPISTSTDYWYELQVTVDGKQDNFTAEILDEQGGQVAEANGAFQADQITYATIYHSGPDVTTKYDNVELGDSSRQIEYYNASGDFISHTEGSELNQLSLPQTNLSRQSYSKVTDLVLSGGLSKHSLIVDVDFWCGQVSTTNVDADPSTSDFVNNCSYSENTGDYIMEEEYDFKPPPGELLVNSTYTGTRNLETNNTRAVGFSGVETNPVTPGGCSESNASIIDVAKNEFINRTIGFSCETGSMSGFELEQILDSDSEQDTRYWYNGTVQINSLETENNSLVIPLDKSELNDWSNKESGTIQGFVDGSGKDITVRGKTGVVEIVVGTDHGNSSLEDGSYTASLGYQVDDNDTTIIQQPSGGGGGGGSETIIREVFGANYSWTVSSAISNVRFSAYPGRSFRQVLTVENTGDKRIPMNVTCLDSSSNCAYVDISTSNFTLERGGSKDILVKGSIPEDYSRSDFPADFSIRFTDPTFNAEENPNQGVAFVDFKMSYAPIQGAILETIYKFGESRELPSPTSYGQTISYPFLFIPLFWASLVMILWSVVEWLNPLRKDIAGSDWSTNLKWVSTIVMFLLTYIVL